MYKHYKTAIIMNWSKFDTIVDGVIAHINYDYNKQKYELKNDFDNQLEQTVFIKNKKTPNTPIEDLVAMQNCRYEYNTLQRQISNKSWWQSDKNLKVKINECIAEYNKIYLKYCHNNRVSSDELEYCYYFKAENVIFNNLLEINNIIEPYYRRDIIAAKIMLIFKNIKNYTFEQILEIVTKDGKY